MLAYQTHANNGSMYNTPPTYAWYLAGLVFQWVKRKGGVEAMAEINQRKAQKLYDMIDSSTFYNRPVDVDCRSRTCSVSPCQTSACSPSKSVPDLIAFATSLAP